MEARRSSKRIWFTVLSIVAVLAFGIFAALQIVFESKPQSAPRPDAASSLTSGAAAGAAQESDLPAVPKTLVPAESRPQGLGLKPPQPGMPSGLGLRRDADSVSSLAPLRRDAAGRRADAPLAPEQWLARIEALRADGRLDEAAASLAEFRKRHADYPLPATLKGAAER